FGSAVQLDFVGDFQAVYGAIVVVENLLVNPADGGGLLHDEVRLGIEEDVALHAGHGGDFDFQGVAAADFGKGGKAQADLVLLGVDEVGIVVLASGFELAALRANQGREFAVRGAVPGGLAVVGLDQVGVTGDQFGIEPVGLPGVECERAGLVVGGVEGTFDGDCFGLGEGFGSACGFDVLVDYFLRRLGAVSGA